MSVMLPFFEGLRPTLHIAHRGGALLAPENTILAFRQAVETYRTQMLETDVQMTRDGFVVIAHDDTVDRCTNGSGDIAALSLGELQRLDAGHAFTPDGGRTFPYRGQGVRIPTLREAFAAFPMMRFNIEVKRAQPQIEEAFAEEVERAHAAHRICCGAVDDGLAARLHRVLPGACHFFPVNALTQFVLAVRNEEAPPEDARFSVLDMPLHYGGQRLIDAALIEAARRHSKWINVWTIDDAAEMTRLVKDGVGGIMTDRPDLLRQVLDAAS